jgi:putative tricarboxylic transport membrane protein
MEGFKLALTGQNVLYLLLGTFIGLIVGALPGLGPIFGVALMLPFTYSLPPATAIIFLVSVHAATVYGDSIASILINTPGGAGSIASCWDGYPLAKQGKTGMALGISAFGSAIGGITGWVCLVLISPLLVMVALKIGAAEYFSLGLMALSLLAVGSRGETVKGLFAGGLGLLLAFIGQDPIHGQYRLTFGFLYLEDGIKIIPLTVGLFAISQVMFLAEEGDAISGFHKVTDSIWDGLKELIKRPMSVVRGAACGLFFGIAPALGVVTASLMAYIFEKQASKEPETFGKGNPCGLIAPEVAKNTCVVGDLIPTFTLGIPGSPTTAILLAALVLQGLKPGPDFFLSGTVPYAVFVGILLAQLSFFIFGIILSPYFMKVVSVPIALLIPSIVALAVYGTYAYRNSMIDVATMLIFGLVGYLLKKLGYEPAAVVLGFVLGGLMEPQFNRALLISDGAYSIFVTRPISLSFLLCTVCFVLWPFVKHWRSIGRRNT